jgi:hypothetical protein
MHDNDKSCCSADQQAWIDVVDGMRNHLCKMLKKSKMSVPMFGALTELTCNVMHLHVFANSFDESCQAQKEQQKKRIRRFGNEE